VTDLPRVAVQYSLPTSLPEWELPEVPVPESPEHDEFVDRLKSILFAWLRRNQLSGTISRNLAIRWDAANPRVGVDPDLCWVEHPPPGFRDGEIDSLRLWQPGHQVPRLAIEFVSRHHPYKDYGRVQEKYAVVGVQELWVFDPRRFGPKALGGPVLLQLWERSRAGVLVRSHFGDEPVQSPLLGAWLVPRTGECPSVSDTPDGASPWLTLEEQERARADEALARVKALEAELAALRAK
jgi:Uma2 family endonuclease